MTNLLEALEQSIQNEAYIDIEMNSLEDAYLNIAREEERLLEQLHRSTYQPGAIRLRRGSSIQEARSIPDLEQNLVSKK